MGKTAFSATKRKWCFCQFLSEESRSVVPGQEKKSLLFAWNSCFVHLNVPDWPYSTLCLVNHNNNTHWETDSNESNKSNFGWFFSNMREQKGVSPRQPGSWFLSFMSQFLFFHIYFKRLHMRWVWNVKMSLNINRDWEYHGDVDRGSEYF